MIQDDSLSYALLRIMEELSAMERAVYVLKTAFQFEHPEISRMLTFSEAKCRKIFSRAKKKIQDLSEVNTIPYEIQVEHTDRFITLYQKGTFKKWRIF
ncbi:hypothetical protein J5TS2_00420 [Brevibacillus halotolerans]|nr:hypothetical protein J5TS2_00420 [Brevibacillus halotolerans]